jgi:hypothetical protein
MTINDILLNCGSVHAETTIYIIESGTIKKICLFKNLESRYANLQFKFFTITSLHTNTFLSYSLAFKFYV